MLTQMLMIGVRVRSRSYSRTYACAGVSSHHLFLHWEHQCTFTNHLLDKLPSSRCPGSD
uniref:Uncharacterized protein n=1 Tax=Arundo donax TaxID=35708 RepID=A0A0A9H7L0_ARUDO